MDIDRVREQADNEAIDELYIGGPFRLVDEPKQDIYDLAVILAGLRQLDLPHLIDFSRGSFGKATIMVEAAWFEREFAGNPNVIVTPHSQFSGIKKTIDYEGVEIFCWIKADFVVAA
jgi:hypothetical protein